MGRVMVQLFGIEAVRFIRIVAWARANFGSPRYMPAVAALLWCKMKWELAGRPEPGEPFQYADADLFYRVVAKVG